MGGYLRWSLSSLHSLLSLSIFHSIVTLAFFLFCLISPYWQLLSPLFSLTEAECEVRGEEQSGVTALSSAAAGALAPVGVWRLRGEGEGAQGAVGHSSGAGGLTDGDERAACGLGYVSMCYTAAPRCC